MKAFYLTTALPEDERKRLLDEGEAPNNPSNQNYHARLMECLSTFLDLAIVSRTRYAKRLGDVPGWTFLDASGHLPGRTPRLPVEEGDLIFFDGLSQTLFKDAMASIHQPTIPSRTANTLAQAMNAARAVRQAAPAIAKAIECAANTFLSGHKIIFIGAGTSGRLGILEAAECVPTFGTKPSQILGIMAGGKRAVFRSVEGAEDDAAQGGKDLLKKARKADFVLGLAASGNTPYVQGALQAARKAGCRTALLSCNPEADARHADLVICLSTGPEALSGSTRLKAGSATKMALNAITTGAMARAGKIYENLMVDVLPTNAKLTLRALRLIRLLTKTEEKTARRLLKDSGQNVKTAVLMHRKKLTCKQARSLLKKHRGFLAEALRAK